MGHRASPGRSGRGLPDSGWWAPAGHSVVSHAQGATPDAHAIWWGKGSPEKLNRRKRGKQRGSQEKAWGAGCPPVLTPQVTVPTGTTAWRGSRGA